MLRKLLFSSCLLACGLHADAQDMRWLKRQITALSATNMDGRGYVGKGRDRAAQYIQKQFQEAGLVPVGADSSYTQKYSFPVNTFPGDVSVTLNKKNELIPGEDFLVDASSMGYQAEKAKIKKVDLGKISNEKEWQQQKFSLSNPSRIYLLKNTDTFFKRLNIHSRSFAETLPKGCYIIPVKGKMTWTVSTDTAAATVLYVQDSVMPRRLKRATVSIQNKFIPNNISQNVIGMVPGTVKDSFIVISSHYDHLGRMGHQAIFPGASDNASGTAMMLYLAKYFAAHPQRYNMVFIAFSGEEAGLLGSKYFVEHPTVPLSNIRFLVNLDIMGDATDGVTVVNATEYPKEFSTLEQINNKNHYLPQIKSRGKAANSDHYHFSENGVPAFFIYSNGGKGYYHDVFDKANTLSLTNVEGVAKLVEDFVGKVQ